MSGTSRTHVERRRVVHKSTGGTLHSIPEPVDPVGNAPYLTFNTVARVEGGLDSARALTTNTVAVNASMAALRLATHDSGSGWFATPFPYDSFIHYSTPVYPGALDRLLNLLPKSRSHRIEHTFRAHRQTH